MKHFFSKLLAAATLLFGVSFAMLNNRIVHLNYFWSQGNFPLPLLLGFAFGLGAVFGCLCLVAHMLKLKSKLRKLNRQLNK